MDKIAEQNIELIFVCSYTGNTMSKMVPCRYLIVCKKMWLVFERPRNRLLTVGE